MLTHGSHLVDTARYLGGQIERVNARLVERFGAYCWYIAVDFTDGSVGHLDLIVAVRGDWREDFQLEAEHGNASGRGWASWQQREWDYGGCSPFGNGENLHQKFGQQDVPVGARGKLAQVMHVEWVTDPAYATKSIRMTPEQYRRLWAAIRGSFQLDVQGRPVRIDHPGYWQRDAFYGGVGKASAIDTCNQWVASRLRLAGVRAPLWSPFVQGLASYYRPADQRT